MLKRRGGFTLIELLIVLSIIGMLLSLILPAVQNSRRAARDAVCKLHVRQQASAVLAHEAAHGSYPSGGWGSHWMGDPDRGYGKSQPGGWIYNLLPYVEQTALRSLGSGLPPKDKKAALARVMQTPLAVFNCPERRPLGVYAYGPRAITIHDPPAPWNTNIVSSAAKSDYAINLGTFLSGGHSLPQGPESYEAETTYAWPTDAAEYNGISYFRSEVASLQVVDGTSNTYLIGEKFVHPDHLYTGDSLCMYLGYSFNNHRTARFRLIKDTVIRPRHKSFGSSHATTSNFAFCDGSVRAIDYSIDLQTHQAFGNREDQGADVSEATAEPSGDEERSP